MEFGWKIYVQICTMYGRKPLLYIRSVVPKVIRWDSEQLGIGPQHLQYKQISYHSIYRFIQLQVRTSCREMSSSESVGGDAGCIVGMVASSGMGWGTSTTSPSSSKSDSAAMWLGAWPTVEGAGAASAVVCDGFARLASGVLSISCKV